MILAVTACGRSALPSDFPVRLPNPKTTELPRDPLDCPDTVLSSSIGEASSDELALISEILNNIRPGITSLNEVAQLLGEPAQVIDSGSDKQWVFGFPSETRATSTWAITVLYQDNGLVTILELFEAMSLGQLAGIFGDPSSVYRYYGGEEGFESFTLLFYDERSTWAMIWEALCPGDYSAEVIGLLKNSASELDFCQIFPYTGRYPAQRLPGAD